MKTKTMTNFYNPTKKTPIWTLKQRRMFEALIADYTQYVYNNRVKPNVIRERIKSKYSVSTTYELTEYQQQEIIKLLLEAIQTKEPTYTLKTL